MPLGGLLYLAGLTEQDRCQLFAGLTQSCACPEHRGSIRLVFSFKVTLVHMRSEASILSLVKQGDKMIADIYFIFQGSSSVRHILLNH